MDSSQRIYAFADDVELDEAFARGVGWIKKARPPSTFKIDPDELREEQEWFGLLASSALLITRMLQRVRRDGLALHDEEGG